MGNYSSRTVPQTKKLPKNYQYESIINNNIIYNNKTK